MKSIGIVRKVDELGRIVIPKELRKILNIDKNASLEIYTDEDGTIILKKYEPGCCICGNVTKNALNLKGKLVCKECLAQIKEE